MQETVSLVDHRSPLQVEYSRAAMEQIRRRAHEGLLAAPRVGLGVGGLLLGVRNGARIRVLDSIDIPCAHSAGPAFELTPDEKREGVAMIAEAASPDISRKVGVIGWYCSKTRDDMSLSPADRRLFDELLPGPWQVGLVVRPNVVDAMRAAFFFRDHNGAVTKGLECYVDEWRAPREETPEEKSDAEPKTLPPETSPEAEPAPEAASVVPAAEEKPAVRQPVPQQEIPAPKPKIKTPKAPVKPAARKPLVTKPLPVTRPPLSSRISEMLAPWLSDKNARLALKIAVPVILVLLVALIAKQFWTPKPLLSLEVTEVDGTLLIRWNPEALHGVDHASMFVNDGGQRTPVLIPLDRFQLSSGLLSYRPQSKRVTAKLDAGDESAIGSWFAPPPPAPATPPATAASDPAAPPAQLPPPTPPGDDKTAR